MNPEIAFVATYLCPGCQRVLEADETRAGSWLRCPACGRPGLPPGSAVVRKPSPQRGPAASPAEELLIIGDTSTSRMATRSFLLRLAALAAGVSIPVVLCLAMVQEPGEAAVLGVVTAAALSFLLFGRPRR